MANEVKIVVTAQDKTKGTFKNVGAGLKTVLAGALALGTGMAIAMGKASAAARESAKITKQTAAVIKSTGGVANISAKQVDALATALSKKTGIDDEVIKSGENMLLTFTNIRNEAGKGNDVFNQTIPILNDMSVALGQDMTSSAMQVGKALNDPIKGITALKRVGVTFNDEQVKTIKHLVKTGDVAGAQKIILKELRKEFGGSAEAQATWADKAKVAAGNVQEAFGELVNKYLEPVARWFTETAAPAIEDFFKKIKKDKDLKKSLGHLLDAVKGLTDKDFAGALDAIAEALPPIVDGLATATTKLGEFHDLVVSFEDATSKEEGGPLGGIANAMDRLDGRITEAVKNLRGRVVRGIEKMWGEAKDSFKRNHSQIIDGVKNWVGRVVDRIGTLPGRAKSALSSLASRVTDRIQETQERVQAKARQMVDRFIDRMQELVRKARDQAGKVKGAITDKFSGAKDWLYSKGKAVINGLLDGLKAPWQKLKDWVGGIAKWIKDHKGPISLDQQLLRPAGEALMGGLLSGLKFGFGPVGDFVWKTGSKISDVITNIKDRLFTGFSNIPIGAYSAGMLGTIARLRAAGARSFTTYPGHHPSQARARDVTPHNWKLANIAKASRSVWYVIYNMRIASKNHGNVWRQYHPTNRRGDWQHVRHIHVGWYDRGGMLPSGGMALNASGRPERVLSPAMTTQFGRLVSVMERGSRGNVGGNTYIINATHYSDAQALQKTLVDLDRQGRLAVVKR